MSLPKEKKTYTYEEAFEKSKEYFNGNELSASVFLGKYALYDNDGNLLEETPDDMHRRIAKEFARIEKEKFENPLSEDFIYNCIKNFEKIIPQGSPMSAIGNEYQIMSASNCFVIENPKDSYGGILKSDEEIAQISKRRGGVGLDISNLRPEGTRTHNAAKTSTGIIPFCSRFSNTVREVGQNGRRGAEMQTISIHHPEAVIPWDDEIDGVPDYIEINNSSYGKYSISRRYYNPKKLDFATCKYDETKVTGANISIRLTDEFFDALEKGGAFEQRWPVNSDHPEISKQTSAQDAWDKIIYSAWRTAEPGILFWDNILRESPADCYKDNGFESICTNPCLTGETLVYVADGRGDVPIKQLAEEGKDVDVFCFDDNGNLVIRRMRNPRITGFNEPILKVTLDDGSIIRTTSNHKFMLRDGSYKEVKNLKYGDSLKLLTKYESPIVVEKEKNKFASRKKDYVWLSTGKSPYPEHKYIAENIYGKIKKGSIVHHKDYNTKNNNPENLEVMSKKDHDILHSKDMIGDRNPMRRAKEEWSEEKWKEYSSNMSKSTSGELNGRYSGFTIDQIKEHAVFLTKSLQRRFSNNEWLEYASQKGLPKSFSGWRKKYFKNIIELSKWAAIECGMDYIDEDTRLLKTFQKALSEGYKAEIVANQVLAHKNCENCGKDFVTNYKTREISFCSLSCSNHYANARGANKKRTSSINETYKNKAENIKEKQVEIYSQLAFDLKRDPMMKEWENECKENNISYRLKTKHGFKSYKEVKEQSLVFNHKVVSVELDGYEDVYNGTVDDFHNFFVGGFESKTQSGKPKFSYINNLNCGEIVLSKGDSCRLLLLNVFSFVKNPFTKKAYFDYEEFYSYAKIAQRLMDDMVDIEEECILKILDKIEKDPEEEIVKIREKNLWLEILQACRNGRRTGTGVTAIGDALAGLGIPYASENGIRTIGKIYQTLKFGCYESSVEMAEELGAFPVWNHDMEKENPFLNRIKEESIVLESGPLPEGANYKEINGKGIYDRMKKHGRRNIALLTTAPAGSVSLLAKRIKHHGTSSGIEPQYDVKPYTRKKKGNPGDKNFRTDSIDQNGDHWMHYDVYPLCIEEWKEISGENDISKNPWNGSCAYEIDWEKRVELQAAAQKHVDHSISSTINIPENTPVEKVKEIYETAYKLGCKGVTVYRDNCRTGVLVSKAEEPNLGSIVRNQAPPRPKELEHKLHHVTLKGIRYYVSVGLMNGEPYEVFTGLNHDSEGDPIIPKSVSEGVVIKQKRGEYVLRAVYNGKDTEFKLTNGHSDHNADALTRMISWGLRHGGGIDFAVHQLEKTQGDMTSFSKVLARTLKKYITDGTQVFGEGCPNCETPDQCNIVRQEGCIMCKTCGWTKCA